MQTEIRIAALADLKFLVHLRDRPEQRDAGYIPTGGLEQAINEQRLIVAQVNDAAAGFMIFRHRKDLVTHVTSVCIEEALWKNGIGTAVMKHIIDEAKWMEMDGVTCKCAFDSPADGFWPTLGMEHRITLAGRKRMLKGWVLDLENAKHRKSMLLPPKSHWGRDSLIPLLERPLKSLMDETTAEVHR